MKPQLFGSTEVHKLVEIDSLPLESDWLFPGISKEVVDEHRHWLGPHLVEPGTYRLFMSFHSFVIRTPTLNILVDTCNGNHKQRPSMPNWHMLELPYLQRLARIGLRPDDIDIVMCTHLHADHVGWNTRLENGRWVPTFPRARYVMSRVEYQHYEALHRSGPAQPVNRGSFVDSVLPIIENDQALLVDAHDSICDSLTDEIMLESAPGHSPAGLNLLLKGGNRRACFCGDVIHHALQCSVPELSNLADHNPQQAIATRRSLLERSAEDGLIIMSGHFPEPTMGQAVRNGEAYRFQFLE